MPSMSRINGAIMQIQGQQYALETIEKGCLNQPATKDSSTVTSDANSYKSLCQVSHSWLRSWARSLNITSIRFAMEESMP